MRVKRAWTLSALVALSVSTAGRVEAFQCPIVIQEAETVLDAAKTSMTHPRARWYREEATTLINDAKARHREAKSADDHNRAVAKARIARAAAELARAMSK